MSGALRRAVAAAVLTGALPFAGAVTCTVSAVPVVFGGHNPLNSSPTTSTGRVTVTCQPAPVAVLQSYVVTLTSGGSGTYAQRTLASGANRMNYQLYRDASLSNVWGDGSAGSVKVFGGYLLDVMWPVSFSHTVYGSIPSPQPSVRAGAYVDTITVTVTY